jgi:osmoprotectant transport system substrate-binding protein
VSLCRRSVAVALLVASTLFTACSDARPRPLGPDVIRIGSFDFPESEALAEIYAMALERDGYEVERFLRLASREVVQPALSQDRLDVVPEYLGSALTFASLGASGPNSDTGEARRRLAILMNAKDVDVLQPAPAQNKNVFVTTGNDSFRYELFTLSDIVPVADQLVFGGPPECAQRALCLPGLEDVYGLRFRDFIPLDASGPLTLAALESNAVDVALMFSTDPALDGGRLIVLGDDRKLQPAENVVPMVRHEVVTRHGRDLIDVLNSVSERITTRDLRELNRQMREGTDPHDAAVQWLNSNGF